MRFASAKSGEGPYSVCPLGLRERSRKAPESVWLPWRIRGAQEQGSLGVFKAGVGTHREVEQRVRAREERDTTAFDPFDFIPFLSSFLYMS